MSSQLHLLHSCSPVSTHFRLYAFTVVVLDRLLQQVVFCSLLMLPFQLMKSHNLISYLFMHFLTMWSHGALDRDRGSFITLFEQLIENDTHFVALRLCIGVNVFSKIMQF